MTIEEIRIAKKKAEKDVIIVLDNLEKQTGMKVKYVEFDTVTEGNDYVSDILVVRKFGITLVV